MPRLAPHIPSVPESGIRRILELSFEVDDVIALGVGEPDVPVAPHIREAARRAWADDRTDYTANAGIPELRAALVEKLGRENGLDVRTEQVWVTVGATQALYQAMTLTLAAGDEVLVPDPGYTTFSMGARMLQAEPVPYPLLPERGFRPDIAELERLVTDRTRVLVVNSPSNPLGAVFPRETLRELLALARRHDLWVISDEVYERFVHDAEHVSMAALQEPGEQRVLTAFSLSKTYAMTGVRVGYLVVPTGLTQVMRTVQEATISCVSAPAQWAAVAAVTGDQTHVAEALAHYRANLDAATALLEERGIRHLRPTGAFYLWIDMGHASDGDVAGWAERFLLRDRVAVAPGSAFGRSGEGWIRVCVAAHRAVLLEGLGRLPAPEGAAAPPASVDPTAS
ncbi:aspartate aminotransferase [Clavibacter sp. B3I6]|uniref:pyridoxal phosphate-dependent aminotransferase n=1 Tax=Clavibacter sp. B3I6 TaxID=3042268 RepID=UPI002783EF29|nr:aminotransferase class I/II-fold pyridoxal phosphate-dependent enzyme [Clavibacter sp. B3I6]MDQ0743194.1 aspartate aminotransferase [Clavibacter sp. B3I6]